ncbi:MAG: helix-turn-helix domain-containing protein [Prevotella sp.]|nr:helix-turn-helix domain-containing protein [Prevotella sp.]
MAKYIGINKSLLAKYIYGIKKPSAERMQKIKQAFHSMGHELIAV